MLSRRTRRPAPSLRRLSSGRHAGPAARSTRMAATPKPAPSPCIGIACPAVSRADPGRSSAPRSRRFGPAVYGVMPSRRFAGLRTADRRYAPRRARRRQCRQERHRLHPQARSRRRSRRCREPAPDRCGREAGFTINLSADNPAHADRLAELGIAPIVTVFGRAYARKAVRHRSKRRRDQWAETIGEWRDRTASLRGTRQPDGGLRSARRRTPMRPARPAAPALGFGTR